MSSNTYSNPKLVIGDKEIISFKSIQFTDNGKNLATSLNVTLSDPEIRRYSLSNKEVTFFLNYGSDDTVPFFRGIIRQVNPTDTKVQFTAYDVRTYLTGKESLPLELTDESNFDGFTLGQFLIFYIKKNINVNETLIGLDLLNDTNPIVSLSDVRTSSTSPLKLVIDNLPKDSSSFTDIRKHRLSVIDDGVKSNLVFVKEQSINDVGVPFTYSDGIKKLTVKKRQAPNLLSTVANKTKVVYKHNNLAGGVRGGKIEGSFSYPDEAIQQAFIDSTLNERDAEIVIDATKGHYLNIGNVVNLTTPDYVEMNGKHRIVSKQVTCSTNNISCNLQLSKEKPVLTDFISSSN
tara:strand:- start:41 stop:1081 length:1041 start_codon:yes stop_codon:yes gene_type:complete